MILDDYLLRDFTFNFGLVVGTLVVLSLIFTMFELLGDMLRPGHVSWWVMGEYLLNLTPFLLYNLAQYSVLLAVLITLGLMQRSNEITALKATGISVYRIVIPVLLAAVLVAFGLFVADEFYLPHTNKRQDALLNEIKGKPAQTYLNPYRKWIFGQRSTIYYYQVFDSDRNQFGDLSVFQFNPKTFQLVRCIPIVLIGMTGLIAGFVPRDGNGLSAGRQYRISGTSTCQPLMPFLSRRPISKKR